MSTCPFYNETVLTNSWQYLFTGKVASSRNIHMYQYLARRCCKGRHQPLQCTSLSTTSTQLEIMFINTFNHLAKAFITTCQYFLSTVFISVRPGMGQDYTDHFKKLSWYVLVRFTKDTKHNMEIFRLAGLISMCADDDPLTQVIRTLPFSHKTSHYVHHSIYNKLDDVKFAIRNLKHKLSNSTSPKIQLYCIINPNLINHEIYKWRTDVRETECVSWSR